MAENLQSFGAPRTYFVFIRFFIIWLHDAFVLLGTGFDEYAWRVPRWVGGSHRTAPAKEIPRCARDDTAGMKRFPA